MSQNQSNIGSIRSLVLATILIGSIWGTFIFFIYSFNSKYILRHPNEAITIDPIPIDTLSIQHIYEFCKVIEMKFPDIVVAQSIQECGFDYSSDNYRNNCNLFGMNKSSSRPSTNRSYEKGYANYKDWKMSVIDYKLLQDEYFKGVTERQYWKWLESYAEDSLYVQKVKAIRAHLLHKVFVVSNK